MILLPVKAYLHINLVNYNLQSRFYPKSALNVLMTMVQPENHAKVKDGFDIYCKKLEKTITIDHEIIKCPECGAQLTNLGFALVE